MMFFLSFFRASSEPLVKARLLEDFANARSSVGGGSALLVVSVVEAVTPVL